MDKDMQLLRDLWKRIDPISTIGADNAGTADIKRRNDEVEKARIQAAVMVAREQVARARENQSLHKLPRGLKLFSRYHKLISTEEFHRR